MSDESNAMLSLASYPGMPYPATLSDKDGELWVSADVQGKFKERSVQVSLKQGFQVHIQLGRKTAEEANAPETEGLKLRRLAELLLKIEDGTVFSCEATCIGEP